MTTQEYSIPMPAATDAGQPYRPPYLDRELTAHVVTLAAHDVAGLIRRDETLAVRAFAHNRFVAVDVGVVPSDPDAPPTLAGYVSCCLSPATARHLAAALAWAADRAEGGA